MVLEWEGEAGGAGCRGLLPASLQPCQCPGKLLGTQVAESSSRMGGLKAQAEAGLPPLTPGEDSKAEGGFPAPLLGLLQHLGERGASSKPSCPAWERLRWGSPTSRHLPRRAACRRQVPLGVPSPVGAEARCDRVLRATSACTAPAGAAHLAGGTHAWRCPHAVPSPHRGGVLAPPCACTAPSRPG